MIRQITDSTGRVWECAESAFVGDSLSDPRRKALIRLSLAMLHCSCGDQRVAFSVPRGWEDLPDERLVRRLEAKLAGTL
ncbi:MAG: hypothetical protein ACR2OG_01975 [Gemmatimonadaceae bacterium]